MNIEQEVLDEQEYVEEAIHRRQVEAEDAANHHESAPLLRRKSSSASIAWTSRRASLWWLLPPFFFSAVMTGAGITPRLSLLSNLLCKSFYAANLSVPSSLAASSTRTTTMGELFAIGDEVNCNIAEISGQIARLSTLLNTVTGLLSAITAAKIGLWSDRNGRRYPLMITMCGSFLNDLCWILVSKYYDRLTIYFLVIGAVCDGLTGSFMSAMAASYAYTTDVVSPQKRAVAFGYFQCSFYGGMAIGPVLGGYLVKRTGSVLVIFYLAMAVHAMFALWTLFVLPESLSRTRMDTARLKHEAERDAATPDRGDTHPSALVRASSQVISFLNVLKALAVFFPRDAHPIIRRNLRLLMAIDVCLLLNMGTFTVIILYGKYVFGWGDLEQGYLLSLIGGLRVVVLLAVLPIIVRFVRGRVISRPDREHDHEVEHPLEGADTLDMTLIRTSMALEVLSFSLFASATSSTGYFCAGAITASAGIGMPALASVLTKHVPATQTGRLLGAVALMQSLNRVGAPLLFGLLYSATVRRHPATCFVVLVGVMASGFLLSLGLRPSTPAHLKELQTPDLMEQDDEEER